MQSANLVPLTRKYVLPSFGGVDQGSTEENRIIFYSEDLFQYILALPAVRKTPFLRPLTNIRHVDGHSVDEANGACKVYLRPATHGRDVELTTSQIWEGIVMKAQGTFITYSSLALAMAASAYLAGAANAESMKEHGHRLLLKNAVDNADFTEVTLPIFEGQRTGDTVWFVVTESSDRADAERRGVHHSPKMANGKGTLAVQKVGMIDGRVQFLGSVDFAPERTVVPSATGFPPKEAKPGAIGEALYTPLIELPNGIVLK